MTETAKETEDPNFQGGVMSPNSKRNFSEMRHITPVFVKQKIVLDEDQFEHSFLRCLVCQDRYNMTDRLPRLLPCHHAFCTKCVTSFYRKEAEYRNSMAVVPSSNMTFAVSVTCPNCKANFITTEDGIRQLTTDHRIVQLLDFVGTTDKQTVTYCSSHAMQAVNFFCEKCGVPICKDCTVLDHKSCSKEQFVIDITTAKQKYLPVIEEGKNNFAGEVKALEERKKECETMLESCNQGDDTLARQIKDVFKKIRKALDDREQELLEMAKAGQENSFENVDEKIKSLGAKSNEVKEILAEIEKASKTDNVPALYKVFRQIRAYNTEPGLEKSDSSKKDETASTFNARDESLLISRIANFGDIQTRQSNGYSSSTYTGSSYTAGGSYTGGSSLR
ncbi:hypothetical protein DPMN_117373 [Dreissena polymorpha]|uniref:Uncharacterized protein n=1 Tax=Dreissena polymorpha TaxID=45954 RepID=A0A9D4QV52_DREPO|nr:hypothetical protein DPMN_117373 [Dreissena polymorpha]